MRFISEARLICRQTVLVLSFFSNWGWAVVNQFTEKVIAESCVVFTEEDKGVPHFVERSHEWINDERSFGAFQRVGIAQPKPLFRFSK